MKMKRVLSVLLAAVIVVSCFAVASVAVSGASADVAASGSAYDSMQTAIAASNSGLSETVDQGTIIQAWNWSFKNIEANLEKLASQGFTTVQVSPPNEIKKATKGVKVTAGDSNGWWMFYQPVGFQLNNSTDNALGTKSEFVSMCAKAHSLGMKVIVDAVINHVGTKDGTPDSDSSVMNHVNDKVKTFEPVLYNNQLFHSPWKKMQYIESNASQYDSTYDLTRNCTSGLPDLKTEDQRVQDMIYEYLDELVTAGADGFRFDAAKHIETPDDISSLRSDFWTDTLVKVQKKYSDKEIYAYGEILNTCGINRPFSMYTKLFDVTDSGSYWNIKDAVVKGGSNGNAIPYYPNSNFTSKNTVLWDESHDTYCDGGTTSLTSVQRGKIWALVAGRKDISCVYFARPDDGTNTGAMNNITLGDAKSTSWANATTKAVNQFNNYFIGQDEYCSSSGGTAWIERGSTGAVIVNLGGTTSKSVSLTNHKLTNGTYKDAITGNTFTVSGGKITGSVGNTGVAVIYENNATPTEKPTDPPVTYVLGDIDETGEVDNVDATYILRYAIGVVKSITDKQVLEGDVDGDKAVTVIDATYIQRYAVKMSTPYAIGETKVVEGGQIPTQKPTTQTPTTQTPTTQEPTTYNPPTTHEVGDTVTLYFSNNKFWDSVNVYMWSDGGESTAWPGVAATYVGNNDYGEGIYSVTVDTNQYTSVIFNGSGGQTEDVDVASAAAQGCGLYCLDEQNDLGHFLVGYYEYSGPIIDDPTTYNPPTTHTDGETVTLYFSNNKGWDGVNVYMWSDGGESTAWPGVAATYVGNNDYGEGIYSVTVDTNSYDKVIFNGSGGQTEDVDVASAAAQGCGLYCLDDKNDLGHYLVGYYEYTGTTSGNNNTEETQGQGDQGDKTGVSFLLTDNFGWGTAYVYAWDDNGNELNGAWPGSAQAETITNDYGETQFRCYVPEGATGVILSNGNGAQTEDIKDFGTYDGYWMDGSKNDLGHFIVTGWNY